MRSFHKCDESDTVEIAVSYDGTWSKRGYTANFGVGFIISIDTGEVLDYDFESKLCMECTTAKQDLGEDTAEFNMWFIGHQEHCTQTHVGSSGSMECSIAKKIWQRSAYLQYKFMICDGDSKAYRSIWDTMEAARTVKNGRIRRRAQKNIRHGQHSRITRNGRKGMTVVRLIAVEA